MINSLSPRDIATLKRIAHSTYPNYDKLAKLAAKIDALIAEKNAVQQIIDAQETYMKQLTGCSTLDIIDRVTTRTPLCNADGTPQLDDKGKQKIKVDTTFVLKYPDTIVPVEETVDLVESDSSEIIDTEATVDMIESTASDAAYNPVDM